MGPRVAVVDDQDGPLAILGEARRHLPGGRRRLLGVVGVDRQSRVQRRSLADVRFEERFDEAGLADARQSDQAHALAGLLQRLFIRTFRF